MSLFDVFLCMVGLTLVELLFIVNRHRFDKWRCGDGRKKDKTSD